MFGWRKNRAPEADRMGRFPAWYAAMEGRTDDLRAALAAGMAANHKDTNNLSMLGVACEYGHADCIALLLDHGADPNACDKHGNGPLWAATREASMTNRPGRPLGNPAIVAALLAAGADPQHRNAAGTTPAGWASMSPELQQVYRAAGYAGEFVL